MIYKAICRWLLLVLGLEGLRGGQAEKQGWLLLVPGLGLPKERGTGHTKAKCCLFERLYGNLNHEPMQADCMERPLEMAWVGLKVGWNRGSPGWGKPSEPV